MPGKLQPLVSNQPIVDANGYPNQYFIRWAQQKQEDIAGSVSFADAEKIVVDFSANRQIIAGTGLTGGGTLDKDVTLKLKNTAVTPDTYGDSNNIPVITKVEKAPVAGGGGGGGASLWVAGPTLVANPTLLNATATGSFAGDPNNSFGFTAVNNFYWGNSSGAASITFDFGAAIVIIGIMPVSHVVSNEDTWQAEGSNDNVTFTALGAPQQWGAAKLSPILFANTTAYRYYRLRKVSGSTTDAAYQQWFLFRTP